MMREHLQRLLANYRAGLRLACFQSVKIENLHRSPDQLVLLFIVDLLCQFALTYFTNLPYPEFNSYAVPVFSYHSLSLLGAAYLIAVIVNRPRGLLLFPIAILSLLPVIYLFWMPLGWLLRTQVEVSILVHWVLYILYMVWIAVMAVRIIGLLQPGNPRRYIGATLTALVVWYGPTYYFTEYRDFWYASSAAEDEDEDDSYARYRELDVEGIYYHQPELLNTAFAQLQPERPGVADLYFVGFASYAHQDVFNKETEYARALFDKRFDTQGHSIILTNHLDRYTTTPLANSHNLAATLKTIGSQMNLEEDVLVLYLTSHGSKEHELSVNFWPLQLNDITPAMLKGYLDEAGIKWRVIMVSACYSGGFVEPLQDAYSIIATASAADRTSFGCGDDNDFTYFGEAVFKDQLSTSYSIIQSLHAAREAITVREQAEKLQASNPQTFIGAAILSKLEKMEQAFTQAACGKGQVAGEDRLC